MDTKLHLRECADRASAIDAIAGTNTTLLTKAAQKSAKSARYHWDLNLGLPESQPNTLGEEKTEAGLNSTHSMEANWWRRWFMQSGSATSVGKLNGTQASFQSIGKANQT